MPRPRLLLPALALLTAYACSDPAPEPTTAGIWLTRTDESAKFERQAEDLVFGTATADSLPTIAIDTSRQFQTMDGFGYSLTGGSALVIDQMSPAARRALLEELFRSDGDNIGISYLRLSIGSSDLDERPFSYLDLPPGETGPTLSRFSIDEDRKHLIPVLKTILEINPDLQLMGSPWSAPAWMKDNQDTRGGSLLPEYYPAYAEYFVKYLQAMEVEGITLDAITVQNEPLHPGNNPSMYMEAVEQADFIKNHLGPAFREAGLDTKIVIYDHNLDRIDYPLAILSDAGAAQYIDGSAFHLYGGTIEEMSKVHESFPEKNLYFTEQWIGDVDGQRTLGNVLGWHMKNLVIGAPRNWAKVVLEWNLASDENWDPHTDRGGCDRCIGALTVQGDTVTRQAAYYIIAHAAKHVRPGSIRIASTELAGLPNVAYRTPEDRLVLIVLNDSEMPQSFAIAYGGQRGEVSLEAGGVVTLVWEP